MSKKIFQFNEINKKFEVLCNMDAGRFSVACPVIKTYQSGIGTELSTSANDLDKTFVRLADTATVETINTMFDVGQSICKCCRFNESKVKVK